MISLLLLSCDVCDKNLAKLQEKMQKAVDSIGDWYSMNRLKVNPKKSKLIIFASPHKLKNVKAENFIIRHNGVVIPLFDEVRYLGLDFQKDLSWSKCTTEICRKANYKITQLKQLRKAGAPNELLLNVYKTFIQCIFDYGISIWGMTTQENLVKVQRKQNRMARIITGQFDRNVSGLSLVKQLGLQSIVERRDYFMCKYTFESIHGTAPDYLSTRITLKADLHPHNTRASDFGDVHPPPVHKAIFRRSLHYHGAVLWNQLPSARD